MAIQSSSANKLLRLPDEAISSIFSYLKGGKGALALQGDDRAVLATAAVCRSWRDDPILQKERREATARLSQRIKLQDSHREFGRLIEEYRKRDYDLKCRVNSNILELFREETPLKTQCRELVPSPSQIVSAKKWPMTRIKATEIGVLAILVLSAWLASYWLGD